MSVSVLASVRAAPAVVVDESDEPAGMALAVVTGASVTVGVCVALFELPHAARNAASAADALPYRKLRRDMEKPNVPGSIGGMDSS